MKIAAIDIGTNSVHMVIAQVEQQRIFEIVDREKEMVFLGRGSLLKGKLPRANIERALTALAGFKVIADTHQVSEIVCTATSAVREASNGKIFIDEVKKKTGITVRVLSGKEEARMITLAVRDAIDLKERRALIVDIGGGSVELIVADARHIYFAESLPAGVIRLTERFLHKDPPSTKQLKKLGKWLKNKLEPISQKIQDLSPEIAVGTSGTILAFGDMIAERFKESKAKVSKAITIDQLEEMNEELEQKSTEQRSKIPGLDGKRAGQIVAGGMLLERIMEACRFNELILCDRALREGLIANYLIGKSPAEPASIQARELRKKSVVNLLHRWELDRTHATHIAALAVRIFDGLSESHRMGPYERELLEYSALLHDIGRVISYPGHHKHGWYIIRHANLIGFQPAEVEIMAAVAAYHRRKRPKKKDVYLENLNKKGRRVVRMLSGILRVADALDRQHNQSIARVEVVQPEEGRLAFVAVATGPAMVSLRAAIERSDLLQRVLKIKNIQFQIENRPEAAASRVGS